MPKVFNTHTFNVHAQERDAVVLRDYVSDRNLLSYKRIAPKRVKDFPGMEKTEVKHTLTGVDGSIIGIQTVATSIRADATLADRSELNDTTKAALADATYFDLVLDQRLPMNI